MNEILPSIFGADILNLQKEIDILESENVRTLHVDMMDGNFVSNIAFGPNQVQALKEYSKMKFDIHMMLAEPLAHLDDAIATGAEMICVHYESTPHIHFVLQQIKKVGCKAGVALSPGTPETVLKYLLDEIDYVLVMSINPGQPGQRFIPQTVDKIKNVREMVKGRDIKIEVDGGINDKYAAQCAAAGADMLVVGGYLFNGNQVKQQLLKLRNAVK